MTGHAGQIDLLDLAARGADGGRTRTDTVGDGRGRHENSRAAASNYSEAHGSLRARILAEIESGGPGTDAEIAERMGFVHKSAVQPRISELVKSGELVELTNERSRTTGCRNRVVGIGVL